MFACQVQTEPALHCAQQLDLRLLAQNFLNEIEIGKIVLDVKDGALAGGEVLVWCRFILIMFRLCGRWRFGSRKIDPKSTAASNCAAGTDTAPHRMHDTGRESKAKASSLYRRLFCSQAVKGRK